MMPEPQTENIFVKQCRVRRTITIILKLGQKRRQKPKETTKAKNTESPAKIVQEPHSRRSKSAKFTEDVRVLRIVLCFEIREKSGLTNHALQVWFITYKKHLTLQRNTMQRARLPSQHSSPLRTGVHDLHYPRVDRKVYA